MNMFRKAVIGLVVLGGLYGAARAGLESATYLTDLVTTNPTNADLVSAGDDHLRLMKTVLQATFPTADKAFYFPNAGAKTANYNVVAADQNKLLTGDATGGTFAFTLPSLAAGDDGWEVYVQKIDSTANAVTVTATIEGLSNWSFPTQYDGATFIWSGTAWNVKSQHGRIDRVFAKTANATLATTELESTILVTPASTTTITLPAASGRKGRWYIIKRAEASTFGMTIDANASETIDGNLTIPVWAGQSIKLVGDGTNWFIAETGGRLGRPAPGTIEYYGGTTIPVGAFELYASTPSRTVYQDLFAAIGTTYGTGDGSTTFTLPDCRGRAVAGEDDMGGSSANRLTAATDSLNGDTLGATGGLETQTLAATESGAVAHTHNTTINYIDNVNLSGGGTRRVLLGNATGADGTIAVASAANSAAAAASAVSIVQPTIIFKCIIWY